jgi:putative membrane protein
MAWLSALYPWIKALHIISIIAWMAGLLYLPRLFVYHCGAEPGSVQSETFKTMERRLLRGIMNPAMISAYIFGYLKLLLVAALTFYHHLLGRWRRAFSAEANHRPARFYRLMNEVPTVIMIGIVILIVVKPF